MQTFSSVLTCLPNETGQSYSMYTKYPKEVGQKEFVATIKEMFRGDVKGDLQGRLLTFIEMLGQEEEDYGGMSSLKMIIDEVLPGKRKNVIAYLSNRSVFVLAVVQSCYPGHCLK